MTPGTSKPAAITRNLTAQWFIPQPHGMGTERVAVIRKFTLTQRCHVVSWFDVIIMQQFRNEFFLQCSYRFVTSLETYV